MKMMMMMMVMQMMKSKKTKMIARMKRRIAMERRTTIMEMTAAILVLCHLRLQERRQEQAAGQHCQLFAVGERDRPMLRRCREMDLNELVRE
jgi:hypothetical protein